MRVFVPYNAIDNDDEVVIKCSVNGGDWQEKNAIFQPGLLKDLKVPMARSFILIQGKSIFFLEGIISYSTFQIIQNQNGKIGLLKKKG